MDMMSTPFPPHNFPSSWTCYKRNPSFVVVWQRLQLLIVLGSTIEIYCQSTWECFRTTVICMQAAHDEENANGAN
eukprot:10831570-Ditylum_brightwellii.AAC.1